PGGGRRSRQSGRAPGGGVPGETALGATAVLGVVAPGAAPGAAPGGGRRSRQSGRAPVGGVPGETVLGATAVLGVVAPGAAPGDGGRPALPGGAQPGGRRSRPSGRAPGDGVTALGAMAVLGVAEGATPPLPPGGRAAKPPRGT